MFGFTTLRIWESREATRTRAKFTYPDPRLYWTKVYYKPWFQRMHYKNNVRMNQYHDTLRNGNSFLKQKSEFHQITTTKWALFKNTIGGNLMNNERRRGGYVRKTGPFPTSLCPCSRKVVVAERGVVEGALKRVNQHPRISGFGFADEAWGSRLAWVYVRASVIGVAGGKNIWEKTAWCCLMDIDLIG